VIDDDRAPTGLAERLRGGDRPPFARWRVARPQKDEGTKVQADDSDHHAAVAAWMQGPIRDASPPALLAAFEAAFGALWRRSYLVLGEVTLVAILDRVLATAVERYPLLADVAATASGLDCTRLRSQRPASHVQLAGAVAFVLVEFLTVLGNLTAEILTPALHAELARDHAAIVTEPSP